MQRFASLRRVRIGRCKPGDLAYVHGAEGRICTIVKTVPQVAFPKPIYVDNLYWQTVTHDGTPYRLPGNFEGEP